MAPRLDDRIPGSTWADVAAGTLLVVLCVVGVAMIAVGLKLAPPSNGNGSYRAPINLAGVHPVGYPTWEPRDEAGRPIAGMPYAPPRAAQDATVPDRYSPHRVLRKEWLMSALYPDRRVLRVRPAAQPMSQALRTDPCAPDVRHGR